MSVEASVTYSKTYIFFLKINYIFLNLENNKIKIRRDAFILLL